MANPNVRKSVFPKINDVTELLITAWVIAIIMKMKNENYEQ
jgi:hypothetical protein